MKAVLLAAGAGRRFHPFNYYRPKPMFPIANKPVLQRAVEKLVAAGVTDIVIVVGHRKGRAINYFGDGSAFGCKISYAEQPAPLGTADALLRAKDFVQGEEFLVLYGDLLFGKETIPALLKALRESEHGVAAVAPVDQLTRYTTVGIRDGKLTDYTWKAPGHHAAGKHSMIGLFGFKPGAMEFIGRTSGITQHVANGIPPREEYDLAEIIPLMAEAGKPLSAHIQQDWYLDMDYPWEPVTFQGKVISEMAEELTETKIMPGASVHPDAKITGPIFVDEGAVVKEDAYVNGPTWIGKRTVIKEGSHIGGYTVIGNDCEMGPYCQVGGSIGNNCHMTHCCEFWGVALDECWLTHYMEMAGVFGERSEIGAATMIGTRRFDDKACTVLVDGQLREAPGFSGVLFGDYSRTGVGAIIMPGRIVGPSAMVGAGVVLTKNVEPFTCVQVKQEQITIPWPQEIYDR